MYLAAFTFLTILGYKENRRCPFLYANRQFFNRKPNKPLLTNPQEEPKCSKCHWPTHPVVA